jgi:hypothetical protein
MQVVAAVAVTTVQLVVHRVFQAAVVLVVVVRVLDMEHMMHTVDKPTLEVEVEAPVEETALTRHLVETVAVA